MSADLGNLAVVTRLEKVCFHTIPTKGNAEECPNYCTTEFISHAGKVMLKILQARSLQCVNRELPDVQARFRKGRASEIKF